MYNLSSVGSIAEFAVLLLLGFGLCGEVSFTRREDEGEMKFYLSVNGHQRQRKDLYHPA